MLEDALSKLEGELDAHLETLKSLVRIGGVSANPPPDEKVNESARAVEKLLRDTGFENTEVIEFPGGHPYVYGDWLHAGDDKPTVLLYGHHDVMPPGRPEKWKSPPFSPEVREGRLFGRGAVDDKAGVMMHVAACKAWLDAGGLPLNVKFIVEGEEEVGSGSLEAFLSKYKDKLACDVLVLTDTANLDIGIPSLTVSLRGLCGLGVELRSLDHPIHSGMWGGPVPDPVMGLCKAIAGLTDERGRLRGDIADSVRPPSASEREALERLPFDEASFREQVGMQPTTELVGDPEMPVWGRIFRQPSVTVIAFEARPIEGSTNQIIESARARISIRTVADMDPKKTQDALVRYFEEATPWGLELHVDREATASWWMTSAEGPAFDAAARALEKGYDRQAEHIGCGGSIPFVEPFANVLGGIPALLMGVEDPICNAHGENESLHIGDWQKGTRAAVYLYEELSRS